MMRRARLTIDAAALRHNLGVARRAAGPRRIFAAIKADGYGHGMQTAASAFAAAGAEGFAVATPGEALALRGAGFDQRLLVLQGALDAEEMELAIEHSLDLVFHDLAQIRELGRWCANRGRGASRGHFRAWLKLDTGMHRAGLMPAMIEEARARLENCPAVADRVGLMTHFARADEPDPADTRAQIDRFAGVATGWNGETSLCNSAALLGHDAGGDWVRPGIMLYGGNPFIFGQAADRDLRAGMHLRTVLVAVREVPRGGSIGYGGRFIAPERMAVGIAAVGYGDGYPRHAPDGTPIRVNGQTTRIIGRVSMDMVTVDLRGIEARVGDEVECWGDGLPIDSVARSAGTISYELMCRMGSELRAEARVINA
ncbi:alanine racemase [Guyparkeria sp.]|uniref:alanine racemase n=1 Tax=Guyparkeria sp. TaxID=2035736 RepID=UPI003569681A